MRQPCQPRIWAVRFWAARPGQAHVYPEQELAGELRVHQGLELRLPEAHLPGFVAFYQAEGHPPQDEIPM